MRLLRAIKAILHFTELAVKKLLVWPDDLKIET